MAKDAKESKGSVDSVTTVSVKMVKDKSCKSCVRYRGLGAEADTVGSSFYLQNKAYDSLGKPDQITLTVSV